MHPTQGTRHTARAAIAAAALLVAGARAAEAGELRIFHFDVEQGDATLIVSPDGHAMLVDGGPTGTGTRRIVPRLRALGVARLDATVATHYHEDHIGGIDEVVAAGFAPALAFDRGDATTDVTQSFRDYVAAVGAVRHTILPGQTIELGSEVVLTCVAVNGVTAEGASAGVSADEENESSVALVLRYKDFDYFVGGDLTGGAEGTRDVESLAAPCVRDLDVLRCGHHGSSTSTNQALLDRCLPEVAIISCGTANGYGHPDQDVLDRLQALPSCAAIFATNPGSAARAAKLVVAGRTLSDADGEIDLATDGASAFTVNGRSFPIVADRTAPRVVSAPAVVAVSGRSVTLAWTTDEPTEALVEVGTTTGYGRAEAVRSLARQHVVTVSGLSPATSYHARAGGVDASGNGPARSGDILFTTTAASAGVVINEVSPAGSGADEWVELLNTASSAIDLAGWTLGDNDGHTFTLPSCVLAPKAFVVVTSGAGADGPDARGVWTFAAGGAGRFGTTACWNNPGDDVELNDAAGRTVDWVAYGSGTGIDAPPAGHWLSGASYPEAPASAAQSLARWPSGADDNTIGDWRIASASTRGASNGGEAPPPPPPPLASAGPSALGIEGGAVSFDAGASAAQGGASIVSLEWRFGDGTTGEGAQVAHVYADSGVYEVTLVVTDSRGLSASAATTAEIANVAPVALAGGPYEAVAGRAVTLVGAGQDVSAADAAALEVAWSFGDGTPPASGASAAHAYQSAGTFTATLTVTDKDGGVAVSSAQVTVALPALRAVFPAVVSARSGATELSASSAEVQDLVRPGEPSARTYVGAGEGNGLEARLGAVGPCWRVESARALVSYRMTSTTWAGTLRLEVWSGGTFLGWCALPKTTTSSTVSVDMSAVVTPANVDGLSIKLVNVEPRELKVIWSYVGVEVDVR